MHFTTRRWLGIALVATLAFRFWLSALLPLTGDEAYFVLWGRHPDLGFYDHPPMVGWLLALILHWSDAEWALRLPVTLLPPVLALMLRAALRGWFGRNEDSANLAALCVLLVPLNFVNVLITTDTPLILFSTLSVLFFRARRAARRGLGLPRLGRVSRPRVPFEIFRGAARAGLFRLGACLARRGAALVGPALGLSRGAAVRA